MKKVICLVLSLVMLMSCVSVLAEGTAEAEDAIFLRIKEGAAPQVYKTPGGELSGDTLEAGQFCGIVDEAEENGVAWYLVFYLNSANTAATGYIPAADAELLKEEDIAAIMADEAEAVKLKALIEALYAYMEQIQDDPAEAAANNNGGQQQGKKGRLAKLAEKINNLVGKVLEDETVNALRKAYEQAKEGLQDALKTVGEKVQEKLSEVGSALKDLKDKVVDGAKNLFNGIADKLSDLGGQIRDKVKEVTEEAGEGEKSTLRDKVSKGLETVDAAAGKLVGKTMNGITKAMDKIRDVTNSEGYNGVEAAAMLMDYQFTEVGFKQAVKDVSELVKIAIDRNKE